MANTTNVFSRKRRGSSPPSRRVTDKEVAMMTTAATNSVRYVSHFRMRDARSGSCPSERPMSRDRNR
jgi:hypothetical protein